MSFNFKKYVKSLLIEDARSSNLAGYTEEAAYENVNNVYVAKDASKDPYTYSVASNNSQEIVIKIESAPEKRKSAVGRKFKITKDNLDNPNVQLLYASIVADKPSYNLNVSGLKFSDINFETIIGDNDFDFDDFFQEQFDKIIAVGKENANTVLKSPNKIFKLSTGQTGELLIKNQGDLTQFIAAIEKNIEQQYDVIVVALGIEVNDVQRAAGTINEQSTLSGNNVNKVYVLMKRGALSYYKIDFAPDISIFIEDNAMIEAMSSPEQPIEINVTKLDTAKVFDNPEVEVVPDVVHSVEPAEDNAGDSVDLRKSSFVKTQEGINVQLSDGTIEASLTLGRNGSLCVRIPNLGYACYKNSLGDIVGLKHVNPKGITITGKIGIGLLATETEMPVTLDKAKKLINDLKSGESGLPNEIEIDGYTFEKVR